MPESSRSKSKEFFFGGSILLAAVFGYFVETHTNDIAALKATNVATCIKNMGERSVMNEVDVVCISETTDSEKLGIGTTKTEMQHYVIDENREAKEVEISRIVGWGVAGGTEMVWPTIIFQALT